MLLLVEQVEWDPALLRNTSHRVENIRVLYYVYTLYIPYIYMVYSKHILYIYLVHTIYILGIYNA